MDELLLLLLKKGSHQRPVKLTTVDIGVELKMSQQNASRLLLLLENEEKISRSKDGISITKKGLEEINRLYIEIKKAFEGRKMKINGIIVAGIGEGGYYISLPGYKKQLKEKLGFVPFEGTLNVKLEKEELTKRLQLRELEPVFISGWKEQERTFGDLYAYKCKIDGTEAAIIIPLRTHHGPEILEIIAPYSLKQKLGKKEGEPVEIEIL